MAQLSPTSFAEAIRGHRAELVQYTHVSTHLLNRLFSSGLLTHSHIEEVQV